MVSEAILGNREYWATAHTNLKPGSQDAEFVKQALAKLREGETLFLRYCQLNDRWAH